MIAAGVVRTLTYEIQSLAARRRQRPRRDTRRSRNRQYRNWKSTDFSRAMLAKAREAAAVAGVELDLRQGDLRDLESDPAQIRSTSEVSWPHYYCRLCEPTSRDLDRHLIRVWY